MPVQPKPPPPPGTRKATIQYIKRVLDGDHTEDDKIKFIKKSVK